ncbi:hypothetical protein ES332_D01G182600v1 [Gossypium tomentosum]|uniref:Uncharacterized protein n=1 Tax=Gossypium tomentosum TaxID=34277 RepID=A0A5D2MAR1_GOSTO|nr:hypothetical protein ES332_D01G182600v1 [Gossypium tomentosum]
MIHPLISLLPIPRALNTQNVSIHFEVEIEIEMKKSPKRRIPTLDCQSSSRDLQWPCTYVLQSHSQKEEIFAWSLNPKFQLPLQSPQSPSHALLKLGTFYLGVCKIWVKSKKFG